MQCLTRCVELSIVHLPSRLGSTLQTSWLEPGSGIEVMKSIHAQAAQYLFRAVRAFLASCQNSERGPNGILFTVGAQRRDNGERTIVFGFWRGWRRLLTRGLRCCSWDMRVLCWCFSLAIGNFHAFSAFVDIQYYQEHSWQPSPCNPSRVCQILGRCAWDANSTCLVWKGFYLKILHHIFRARFCAVFKNQAKVYPKASVQ